MYTIHCIYYTLYRRYVHTIHTSYLIIYTCMICIVSCGSCPIFFYRLTMLTKRPTSDIAGIYMHTSYDY